MDPLRPPVQDVQGLFGENQAETRMGLLVPTLRRGNAYRDAPASRGAYRLPLFCLSHSRARMRFRKRLLKAWFLDTGCRSVLQAFPRRSAGTRFPQTVPIWGDENVPCLAAAIPAGFIPPSYRRAWFGSVGGLKSWRSGLVRSLLTPAPFELVRSPTHHFPSRLDVIRSKKRRIGAENGVGYNVGQPTPSFRAELALDPESRR